jgi:outer membrane protein OmpA-like peptidoglycan-associated protein
MKRGIVFCCFFLIGIFSFSQNLILNPGFEEHGETLGNTPDGDNLRGNHVKNWLSPTDASPDYFLKGDDYLYNQYGPPQAHSGNAMAGIVVHGERREYREYIIGELSAPLEAGKTYDFSMAIALAAFSGEMIDEYGVCFTNERLQDKKISGSLKNIPQLVIDSISQDKLIGKWMVFHETYTAVGGEKFITIGNFSADKKTNVRRVNPGKGAPYAYYYLDDISLTPHTDTVTVMEPVIEKIPADTLKIVAGKKLVVENIYFETDKSVLKTESFPVLDEIISAMKDQPGLKVEIDGHTDAQGTKEHNQKLSEDRAKSVAEYFVSKGIDQSRITTKGFGSGKPVADEESEEGRQKNRRVEFVFSD